jgi:MFS transporter, PAT family, beta-lactamase induction signal transducer AmpG
LFPFRVFKFLWAPVVDRFGSQRLGHYRTWLLVLQPLLVVLPLAMIPLDLTRDFALILVFVGIVTFVSATQDVASDALAVGLLTPSERGFGNGVQLAGGLLGNAVGGGFVLLAYGFIGWAGSMVVLSVGTALPLVLIFRHRENEARVNEGEGNRRAEFRDIVRVFRRPGMGRWVFLILLYGLGLSMVYALLNPMLVDIGWSAVRISVVTVIGGSFVGILGGLLAGIVIRRLGRKRSLVAFGVLQAATLAVLLPSAMDLRSGAALYIGAAGILFAYGVTNTVLYTMMMDRSRYESPGTDYTSQYCVLQFGGIVASAVGVGLAGSFGYPAIIAASVVLTLAAVLFAARTEIGEPQSEPVLAPIANPVNPAATE